MRVENPDNDMVTALVSCVKWPFKGGHLAWAGQNFYFFLVASKHKHMHKHIHMYSQVVRPGLSWERLEGNEGTSPGKYATQITPPVTIVRTW
jgi:hypothetical protein